MSFYRLALATVSLSLMLPCALPVLAADAPPETEPAIAEPEVRPLLQERSQEDAAALERQVAQDEQQLLQAGQDSFLALWKPANSSEPSGAVIIVPGAGENADWPVTVGPLRRKLPDANWASLSLSLPDMQSTASQPRPVEQEKPPAEPAPNSSSKDASTTAKPIEQAASAGTDSTSTPLQTSESFKAMSTADAARIYARIDAALAFAQQQNMRTVVLLGNGTGAYWAARYISERKPPQIAKLILVAAATPDQVKPELSQLTPNLTVGLLDVFYKDTVLARKSALQRLQASKRANRQNVVQVGLIAMPGNREAEQEQLMRRVRGWLSPKPAANESHAARE